MASVRITNLPLKSAIDTADLFVVMDRTTDPPTAKKIAASYLSGLAPVTTVADKTGAVTLGIGDVDALQTALNDKLTAGDYILFRWATKTISGTLNNYSVSPANMLRLNTIGIPVLTGFSGGSYGKWHRIINVSVNNIIIRHNSTNSSDSNRIILPGNADRILPPNNDAVFFYDDNAKRWRSPGCPYTYTS
jgi:hypothetical protein